MKHDTLTLSDGRTIGYAEYGREDAPVVFYCHGFPTCRMELEILEPRLESNHVEARVIALDRPGFGNSSYQSNRSFWHWPADVSEAADRLGIDTFSVLGVSGGAPYAFECAVRLPDRVNGLGIVVGVGPPHATGMDRSLIFRTVPRNRVVARLQFEMFALGLKRGQDERILSKTLENLGPIDRPVLEDARTRDWFLRTLRETFKPGGRGAALGSSLYTRDWGFELSQVEVETRLWYGGRDETVPAQVGEWLAGQLPQSSLEVWPDHGHFTWMVSDEAATAVAATASYN